MGFDDIASIRQGKVIDLEFTHNDKSKAEIEANKMCDNLLANTVIERYEITWLN